MAGPDSSLQQRVANVVTTLQAMEGQLKTTQAEMRTLPFFARGFVERDLSGATGRSFADWIAATARLHAALAPLGGTPSEAQTNAARQAIALEAPKLATLRAYLQRAPEKVSQVPAMVLKPQQRAEFVGRVGQQVQSLHALEIGLSAVAELLAAR